MKKQIDLMLVENDSNDAHMIERILTKENSEYNIVWMKDSEKALNYFTNNSNIIPRLIILDIKMPKITGFEFLEKIRSMERTKFLPVIVFSSSNQKKDIEKAYELGANSYLTKPGDYQKMKHLLTTMAPYWLILNKTTDYD